MYPLMYPSRSEIGPKSRKRSFKGVQIYDKTTSVAEIRKYEEKR